MEKISALRARGPGRFLRLLFRFPILCYRLRIGWLLGNRFLLLTHIGRKSGLDRSTVLEILRYEPSIEKAFVASGWGRKSQWFRNVTANPKVHITIGNRRKKATARQLSRREGERELRDYGQRHPFALKQLAKAILGLKFTGREEQFGLLSREVPVLELSSRL